MVRSPSWTSTSRRASGSCSTCAPRACARRTCCTCATGLGRCSATSWRACVPMAPRSSSRRCTGAWSASSARVARHPHQCEAGERLGAHIGTDGGYDVVVEAAGTKESMARAVDLVAPRGTIVVLGVHLGTVELNWMPLFHREARLIPSLGYC